MATHLNKDTKIVLKLDLDEDGLRRIPFQKLWDESNETVSFDRLVDLILSYKKLPPKCVKNERRIVSATYTDEDGDEITISTDSELLDAFEQFTGSQPPILRAKAVVVKVPMKTVLRKEVRKEQRSAMKEMKQEVKEEIREEIREERMNMKEEMKKEIMKKKEAKREKKLAPVVRLPSVAPPKTVRKTINAPTPPTPPTVGTKNGCDPNFIHGRHTCDGCLTTPIFGLRYHAVNMPDYDLCSKCYPNYTGQDIVFKPVELDRDTHLQNRWQRRYRKVCVPMMNAMNVQTGNNARHDTHNKPRLAEVASGTQTRKVIDHMDDNLKEAIRRSLIEAWPKQKNKKKVVKEEDSKTQVKKEKVMKVDKDVESAPIVEKDIHVTPAPEEKEVYVPPVPRVVDIEAGNEETRRALDVMDDEKRARLAMGLKVLFDRYKRTKKLQKEKEANVEKEISLTPLEDTQNKLDAMDPETREAISRSLNQFFANRRALKEEQAVEKDHVETNDDVEKTKELLESMDDETREVIKRSVGDFVTRHANSNDSDAAVENTEESELPNVVIDIVVDDDLSVGTDDVDVDVEGISEGVSGEVSGDVNVNVEGSDVETASESSSSNSSNSGISGETGSKSWQMVSEHDEMIAVAAQMLGSALFESDAGSSHDSNHDEK